MSATEATHARPPDGTILAFDFGEKRIGVAVGETSIESARALALIDAEDNASRFGAITKLIDEWRPAVLVVGLPLHPDGEPHELTRLARRFAQRLEGRFRLPVALVDERYSSASAQSALREQGLRGERLARSLDAAAAAEILRTYYAMRRAAGA